MAFPGTIRVSTPDFSAGDRMPYEYTADGGNSAPVLQVSGVPAAAVELAVVCHDPDAPLPRGYTHWTLYGIAPDATRIDASSGRTGANSTGKTGYFGPQPPLHHGEHHYYFWVYALSRPVEGEPTREEFLDAYADAIIEQNRVIGTYSRS